MSTTFATTDEIFICGVSDEAVENAGGMSATAPAGSSELLGANAALPVGV